MVTEKRFIVRVSEMRIAFELQRPIHEFTVI